MTEGTVILVGADRPFGAEIADVLRAAGREVAASGPATALVVNVAAGRDDTRLDGITDDAFAAALHETVFATYAAVQAASPGLPAGGAIAVVASRCYLGAWGGAHLAAAQAATIGLVRSLSLELAGRGIRVNAAVADLPGGAGDTPESRRAVAEGVLFLISPGSAGVSGETMLLDGGRSLRMAESRRR